ncbi:TPA: hypothetical protein H2R31_003025 [Salmonella enterica]|nr:hypothetical protein [Salmonella enterica]
MIRTKKDGGSSSTKPPGKNENRFFIERTYFLHPEIVMPYAENKSQHKNRGDCDRRNIIQDIKKMPTLCRRATLANGIIFRDAIHNIHHGCM